MDKYLKKALKLERKRQEQNIEVVNILICLKRELSNT